MHSSPKRTPHRIRAGSFRCCGKLTRYRVDVPLGRFVAVSRGIRFWENSLVNSMKSFSAWSARTKRRKKPGKFKSISGLGPRQDYRYRPKSIGRTYDNDVYRCIWRYSWFIAIQNEARNPWIWKVASVFWREGWTMRVLEGRHSENRDALLPNVCVWVSAMERYLKTLEIEIQGRSRIFLN